SNGTSRTGDQVGHASLSGQGFGRPGYDICQGRSFTGFCINLLTLVEIAHSFRTLSIAEDHHPDHRIVYFACRTIKRNV
ncbi:hypothetical protein, partial [Cognatazoarcus halotolerans]|uniref:hypothetical protein n=1 Tax=Cognatazoarcus halotolerans TaxID=2686016 RepID=UPI001F300B92